MATWGKLIGKFSNLTTIGMKSDVCRAFYLAILCYKDVLDSRVTYDDEKDNPNHCFETLEMAQNPRKGDDKYVYYGIKKTKDKETGLTCEEHGELPMKKFVTVTVEAKVILIFLLSAFIKECKDYYDSHNFVFPSESELLPELVKYSKQNCANHIVAYIVNVTETYNIEKIIKCGYYSIEKKLTDKSRQYFKDKMDKKPDSKIAILIETYVKFINILAIMSTNILYEKRQAINMAFMFGILRVLSTFSELNGTTLNSDIFISMKEYVDSNKPVKKKKGENDDDEDADDEDSTEKKPKKKKAAPKKKAPPKKKASPKKKEKSAESEEDITEAVDAIGDWNLSEDE